MAPVNPERARMTISPIGNERGTLNVSLRRDGQVLVERGCFNGGTISGPDGEEVLGRPFEQFVDAVWRTHVRAGTQFATQYSAVIDFIRDWAYEQVHVIHPDSFQTPLTGCQCPVSLEKRLGERAAYRRHRVVGSKG
jgi:hypothetical protein